MLRACRPRSSSTLVGFTLVDAAVAISALVVLTSPASATTVPPETIRLTLAASPAVATKVETVLRDSFDRRGWALDATTVPTLDPRSIVAADAARTASSVWLDLAAPGKALYLVDQARGMVYTRELDVSDDPDAVELELIRFVVESSLDAMLAGEIQGVPRAEFEQRFAPPEPAAAQPPPTAVAVSAPDGATTAAPRDRLAVAGGYHGQLVGDDALAHGFVVNARWRPFRLGLDGSLRTQWPVHVTTPELDARLWSSSLRLHAALPVALHHHTLLVVGLGGGWEITRVAPAGAGAVATFWASAPLASTFAAVEQSWERLFVTVRFDLDIDLIDVRYQARRAGVTSTDWSPHRFRPSAAALVGVRF